MRNAGKQVRAGRNEAPQRMAEKTHRGIWRSGLPGCVAAMSGMMLES